MLNSRPLVPLSSDLDDLNVLSPSHFLIGRSITSIVEPDLTNLNENRLDNWQKITKIIQLIWKRWSVDYLNSLQQRNKWHFEKKNAQIGVMVIMKEDNLPSCQWSLGRINNIYPGNDSKVRVVEVKTTRVSAGRKKKKSLKIGTLAKPIILNEVEAVIGDSCLNKTPGLDGIHGQMINHFGLRGRQRFLDIINCSWNKGHLPRDWSRATAIPIKKCVKTDGTP
ncbi:integrase catalytic domain-containing protein [Trichonephila clavipes]|nr:integrase catalytic domain-containing protein [Trichonephila clavipes]